MILMIEGLDAVGKTSVAEYVREHTGWPIIHPNNLGLLNHNDWRDDCVIAYTMRQLGVEKQNVIFDRGILSAFAYTLDYPDRNWQFFFNKYLQILGHNDIAIVHLVAEEEWRANHDDPDTWVPLKCDLDEMIWTAANEFGLGHYHLHVDVMELSDVCELALAYAEQTAVMMPAGI